MAYLQTKSFATLVSEQITAIQGGSSTLTDFSIGSILRAIVEAYAAVALWLQGLVLKLLATTRAATSSGADLDSWVADYGLTRLSAVAASGQATFARFTPTAQAVVPVGALVQTADGSQQFAVTLDATSLAYSSTLGGYVIAAGTTSVAAPVAAIVAGALANVPAGAIATIAQAIAGVDTVTNAAPFTNGADAETDTALRSRFVAYIGSLSKATRAAVGFAVSSVEARITYTLVENQDYSGTARAGCFYVVVDDGSGSPSDALLAQVYTAIDAVRPIGSIFAVYPPVVETVPVTMVITVASGFTPSIIAAAVRAALLAYINTLPNGAPLRWSRLIQVAYEASSAVTDVVSIAVSGSQQDIAATPKQVIKAGTVAVTTT